MVRYSSLFKNFSQFVVIYTVTGFDIVSKAGKLSSGRRTGKGQFSFQSQRKAMPKNTQTTTQLYLSHTKERSNYHTIVFISHTSKVMLKILASLHQ